ncbi:MAG: HAD-IC family P-type ATPase [Blautia sp.]|nr:HAD-IC family P-type ATPase [Blautia sp.]MDD5967765.1 HAD-IC family P-type ATPase [Blautia sp.]MDY2898466.1 HAD-IC family P-type ATPase [Candidatus Limivivens sp.]
MTEIKEALFDEEPEKKEEPEKTDPDMEPLFGQEDKIEEAGEENGQTEEPEIRESEKNYEEEPPADNAAEEAPQKKKFFSRFRKKKEKEPADESTQPGEAPMSAKEQSEAADTVRSSEGENEEEASEQEQKKEKRGFHLPFKKKQEPEEPEEEPYVEIPVYSDAEKKAELEAKEKLENGTYVYKGLTEAEVENQVHMGRVNQTGENIFKTNKEIIRDHTLTYFNFLNLFLGILILVSGQFKNITFMGVIIINTLIGIVQEMKVKKLVDKLAVITASKAAVIRDGEAKEIDIHEVVVKDTMVLTTGNQVCADAIVMESDGMEVNESMLTGESRPVKKNAGDRLMSGSFLTAGSGVVQVEYVGEDSYAYQLMKKAKTKKRASSEMQRTINRIIKVVGALIIPIGIMLYLSQKNAGSGFSDCLVGTVAGVIGMIPEGLVLLTSISFILGVGRLARKRALVQEMEAIEALARVNVLCLDKTGTITTGKLEVVDVIGVGDTEREQVEAVMNEMAFAFDDVNNTQSALMKYFKKSSRWRPLEKIPFSSDRKYRAIRYDQAGCFVLGAPEFLLGEEDRELLLKVDSYAAEGLRVLLLASCDTITAEDGMVWGVKPMGLIIISDCIREEAPEIFRYFEDQNVNIKVISGDNPATVSQIALKAGLNGAEHYIDANELPEDFEELKQVVGDYTVYGRVKPEQKQNIIRAYQANKAVVGMVGDGVNDVLALKDADCGIAMAAGSDAAKQVAHIVLLDSDFSCLKNIVSEGRTIIANIERVSSLYLTKTVYSVILCVLFILLAREYPFIPIQLSWMSAMAIGVPSFLLTLEQNESMDGGGFLRHVLRIALPQALAMVVCLLTIQVLTPFWNDDPTMTYMFNLLVGGTVSFMVVIEVCRPMNWVRRTMTVILIGIFALGIILFPGLLGIYSIFRWECVFALPMICMVLVVSRAFRQLVILAYQLKDWAAVKIRGLIEKARV